MTPVRSYCFLNSDVLSLELQMGSKLINKYEITSQIISKDNIYVHVHIYTVVSVYVCVFSVAFSSYSFMLCYSHSVLTPVDCQDAGGVLHESH